MTSEELIAEIRDGHERQDRPEGEPPMCLACSPLDWPCDAVRAAAALEAATAHDAEVAARAWDEGWSARASRGYAHLKVGECVPPPAHINPYRKAVGS